MERDYKKEFEEKNNVTVQGDWNQVIDYTEFLKGYETGYEGNPNNPHTDKQLALINFIQRACHEVYPYDGKTSKDAWDFIQMHYEEAKCYGKNIKQWRTM